MDKNFSPADIELAGARWEAQGYFAPSGRGPRTASPSNAKRHRDAHMGHGFQQAIADAPIRYHRMRGYNTLWQVGTDHAGIATQMVVERQLESEGTNRETLGRDDFIARVWDWKEQSGGAITQQLRRLVRHPTGPGKRFTMDPGLSCRTGGFYRPVRARSIYRGYRLVNWDPVPYRHLRSRGGAGRGDWLAVAPAISVK